MQRYKKKVDMYVCRTLRFKICFCFRRAARFGTLTVEFNEYLAMCITQAIIEYLKKRVSLDLPGAARLRLQEIDTTDQGDVVAEGVVLPRGLAQSSEHLWESEIESDGSSGVYQSSDFGGNTSPNCAAVSMPSPEIIKARCTLNNILSSEANPIVLFCYPSCAISWTISSTLKLSGIPVRTGDVIDGVAVQFDAFLNVVISRILCFCKF